MWTVRHVHGRDAFLSVLVVSEKTSDFNRLADLLYAQGFSVTVAAPRCVKALTRAFDFDLCVVMREVTDVSFAAEELADGLLMKSVSEDELVGQVTRRARNARL